jgi:hypothetical protein
MNTNYCFTLSYNLPSETEKAVKRLYEQNDPKDFKHLIIDLGFPLEEDKIPEDVEKSIQNNTETLKGMAKKYGSDYVKFSNIGVSQNWTQAYKYLNPDETDIIVGVDPDEQTLNPNWVKAMGDVMRSDKNIALCSLIQPEQSRVIFKYNFDDQMINGIMCYVMEGYISWALIGISGKFLKIIGGIPFPKLAPIYGWIESELFPLFEKNGYKWAMLPDFKVQHTECSTIYREWKNDVVFNVDKREQVDFVTWLKNKK